MNHFRSNHQSVPTISPPVQTSTWTTWRNQIMKQIWEPLCIFSSTHSRSWTHLSSSTRNSLQSNRTDTLYWLEAKGREALMNMRIMLRHKKDSVRWWMNKILAVIELKKFRVTCTNWLIDRTVPNPVSAEIKGETNQRFSLDRRF